MEITTRESGEVDILAIQGRVDSVEAVRLSDALGAAIRSGRHWLVIDMSQLEFMSSAGFRALVAAQRNSQRHPRGDLILTQVPSQVRAALEIVGFTEYFKIIDPPAAAVEYAESLSANLPTLNTQSDVPEG